MNLFTYGLDLSTVYLGGSTRVVQTISGYVRNRAVRRFSGTLRQGGDLWCNSKPEQIGLNKSEKHFLSTPLDDDNFMCHSRMDAPIPLTAAPITGKADCLLMVYFPRDRT
jgi:hypothetical protein